VLPTGGFVNRHAGYLARRTQIFHQMSRRNTCGDELRSTVSYFRQESLSALVDQRNVAQIEDAAQAVRAVVVFPTRAQYRDRWTR
jgi:hypothetical protein